MEGKLGPHEGGSNALLTHTEGEQTHMSCAPDCFAGAFPLYFPIMHVVYCLFNGFHPYFPALQHSQVVSQHGTLMCRQRNNETHNTYKKRK